MTKGSEKSKMWIAFAVGSAVFAALTSILAKIGIEDMDSNLATAIRTVVVLVWPGGLYLPLARRRGSAIFRQKAFCS